MCPLQHTDLLPEEQDLELLLTFRPGEHAQEIKQDGKELCKHSEEHTTPYRAW